MDEKAIVKRISEALLAPNLEGLVPPLLDVLAEITGLDSVYLTRIDFAELQQTIIFSKNTGALNIPENLAVPWKDTLCKRALESETFATDDVPKCWPESDAARELQLQSYVSQPVYDGAGDVFGTLCGASRSRVLLNEETTQWLVMFSRIIGKEISRENLIAELKAEKAKLHKDAEIDPLTGVLNRRGLMSRLAQIALKLAAKKQHYLLAYIDLDDFKQLNDQYGHDIGDRFLLAIADTLRHELDDNDIIARIGGDEFVVVREVEALTEDSEADFQRQLTAAINSDVKTPADTIVYRSGSVGIVAISDNSASIEEWLAVADARMYQQKRARKSAQTTNP
ncbi:diguanylate cyclase [Idiomarina tyrosinivorans]|uniref:diguanylate cyclase n=1 Tax=Idiomarina tyrosinivorans TaxID=1445662 RepID=A0A432ZU81_9GAMM|nr:sensor domain-containing diguanylate cyclase [Idiomarina tyrosinivorans]RUO81443.1 diguanylate cyclase [Idiomarina tyrosinivorans]